MEKKLDMKNSEQSIRKGFYHENHLAKIQNLAAHSDVLYCLFGG
jgi:hypothetical protein